MFGINCRYFGSSMTVRNNCEFYRYVHMRISYTNLSFSLLTFDESLRDLRCVAYDNACDFPPFLKRMAEKGFEGEKKLISASKFFIDQIPIVGNTQASCQLKGPNNRYYPNLLEL